LHIAAIAVPRFIQSEYMNTYPRLQSNRMEGVMREHPGFGRIGVHR
jgi:hypothetical protein